MKQYTPKFLTQQVKKENSKKSYQRTSQPITIANKQTYVNKAVHQKSKHNKFNNYNKYTKTLKHNKPKIIIKTYKTGVKKLLNIKIYQQLFLNKLKKNTYNIKLIKTKSNFNKSKFLKNFNTKYKQSNLNKINKSKIFVHPQKQLNKHLTNKIITQHLYENVKPISARTGFTTIYLTKFKRKKVFKKKIIKWLKNTKQYLNTIKIPRLKLNNNLKRKALFAIIQLKKIKSKRIKFKKNILLKKIKYKLKHKQLIKNYKRIKYNIMPIKNSFKNKKYKYYRTLKTSYETIPFYLIRKIMQDWLEKTKSPLRAQFKIVERKGMPKYSKIGIPFFKPTMQSNFEFITEQNLNKNYLNKINKKTMKKYKQNLINKKTLLSKILKNTLISKIRNKKLYNILLNKNKKINYITPTTTNYITIKKYLKKLQTTNKKIIHIKGPALYIVKKYKYKPLFRYFAQLEPLSVELKKMKQENYLFEKYTINQNNLILKEQDTDEVVRNLKKFHLTNRRESWNKKWFETKKETKLNNVFKLFTRGRREKTRIRKKDLFKIKHQFITKVVPFFYGKQQTTKQSNNLKTINTYNSNNSQLFLWNFERQLNSLLVKAKYTPNPKVSKHLIRYGQILIENKITHNPYYLTNILDIIRINNIKSYTRYLTLFLSFRNFIQNNIKPVNFIERNTRILALSPIRLPSIKDYTTKNSFIHFKKRNLFRSIDFITKLF